MLHWLTTEHRGDRTQREPEHLDLICRLWPVEGRWLWLCPGNFGNPARGWWVLCDFYFTCLSIVVFDTDRKKLPRTFPVTALWFHPHQGGTQVITKTTKTASTWVELKKDWTMKKKKKKHNSASQNFQHSPIFKNNVTPFGKCCFLKLFL